MLAMMDMMGSWLSWLEEWLVVVVFLAVVLAGGYLWLAWRARLRRLVERSEQWGGKDDLEVRRAWVRKRVEYWWSVANHVHQAGIEPTPTVDFSPRLKHALGWADSSRNHIRISDHHLMDKSRKVADETIAHEVAHVFADLHHGKPCRHGKLWKQVMVKMGQKPEVCYRPEEGAEDGASEAA
jgi:hypothetical protein